MSNKKYDFSDVEDLLNQGKTIKEILKIKGCKHHFTLYNYLNNNNIKFESSHTKDFTGYEWNGMTVISEDKERKTKKRRWNVKCHCGNIVSLDTSVIIKSKQKSCGCIFKTSEYRNNFPTRTGYKEISGKRWYTIKRNADIRNIKFEITIEEAWEIYLKQNKKCKLSNIPIHFSMNDGDSYNDATASLDRIDSNLGYTVENIQWVHKRINMMKQNLTDEEFKYYCRMVAKNEK